jgi:hypothetical protein
MADPKGAKAKQVADGADVHVRNTISVAMEDLNEEDRKVVEQELKEEMTEMRGGSSLASRRHAVAASRNPTH